MFRIAEFLGLSTSKNEPARHPDSALDPANLTPGSYPPFLPPGALAYMYPLTFPDARATHVSLPTHSFFSGASGSQMHPQNGPISHPSELPTAGNVIPQQGQPSAFPPPYAFPGYSFPPHLFLGYIQRCLPTRGHPHRRPTEKVLLLTQRTRDL
ncbi:hypothetical protein QCA50_020433 [Cerrena zonata]|uniref:Uncharacterized protein n=1 Tax=Cerrena zonata TaxID=2478898 RepID=A0AAW0FBT3_9APHY